MEGRHRMPWVLAVFWFLILVITPSSWKLTSSVFSGTRRASWHRFLKFLVLWRGRGRGRGSAGENEDEGIVWDLYRPASTQSRNPNNLMTFIITAEQYDITHIYPRYLTFLHMVSPIWSRCRLSLSHILCEYFGFWVTQDAHIRSISRPFLDSFQMECDKERCGEGWKGFIYCRNLVERYDKSRGKIDVRLSIIDVVVAF